MPVIGMRLPRRMRRRRLRCKGCIGLGLTGPGWGERLWRVEGEARGVVGFITGLFNYRSLYESRSIYLFDSSNKSYKPSILFLSDFYHGKVSLNCGICIRL